MAFASSLFALLFFSLCLAIQASPVPSTPSTRYKPPFSVLLPRESDHDDNDFTHSEKAGLYTVIFLSMTIMFLWLLVGATVAVLRRTNDRTFWANFKDGLFCTKDPDDI